MVEIVGDAFMSMTKLARVIRWDPSCRCRENSKLKGLSQCVRDCGLRKVEVKAGDEAVVNGLGNAKAHPSRAAGLSFLRLSISWLDHSLIISPTTS